MLLYQVRLALRSLRRNPVLSVMLVLGIGLGIGVAMTFVTAHSILAGDPIPEKSGRLFYVQLDAWDPERPFDSERPQEPPDQLTFMDVVAVTGSEIPTFATPMYKSEVTLHPGKQLPPFREVARLCSADFFRLFDVPFAFGGPWSEPEDDGPGQVVVLGEELNLRLFGGEDSVGRTLRVEDRDFTIVGVLRHWQPTPKFYDPLNGAFDPSEELYFPFLNGREMELRTTGNTSGWANQSINSFADRLQSELIWTQAWVQLDTVEQRAEYAAFLDAYADEQRKLGRFGRPNNNRLLNVREWLDAEEVVPPESRAMLINALLFLLVCSVNLIGILLGKFLARSPEIGVRRALGASRRWVFVQHLVECELIGMLGCGLGLLLAVFGTRGIGRLFSFQADGKISAELLAIAVALALLSALVAGIYPAWAHLQNPPGNAPEGSMTTRSRPWK